MKSDRAAKRGVIIALATLVAGLGAYFAYRVYKKAHALEHVLQLSASPQSWVRANAYFLAAEYYLDDLISPETYLELIQFARFSEDISVREAMAASLAAVSREEGHRRDLTKRMSTRPLILDVRSGYNVDLAKVDSLTDALQSFASGPQAPIVVFTRHRTSLPADVDIRCFSKDCEGQFAKNLSEAVARKGLAGPKITNWTARTANDFAYTNVVELWVPEKFLRATQEPEKSVSGTSRIVPTTLTTGRGGRIRPGQSRRRRQF